MSTVCNHRASCKQCRSFVESLNAQLDAMREDCERMGASTLWARETIADQAAHIDRLTKKLKDLGVEE